MADKKPKAKVSPQPTKIPRRVYDEDPTRLSPAWRVGSMEMRVPFGWHQLTGSELSEIREKLKNFESMTLGEILNRNNHRVSVGKLCKDARDRLKELKLDDIEELLSLRLTGIQRIWGILEHNIVILLWWDPDHLVCPSPKKHT